MFAVALIVVVSLLQASSVEAGLLKRLVLHDDQSVAEQIHGLEATVDLLNATLIKEVAGLKAAIQAEKKERCQVGVVGFHKLTCTPNPSCHESINIQFNPAFNTPPSVVFAIDNMDIDATHNLRITSSVSHVTTLGATLTVTSWADTIIYGSGLSWMACPTVN